MKRLLVVEDHPWVLQALCHALGRSGDHIASATTLRQARREILETDPYDAVICEQHLSDGTALELLGWLRWRQRIPVPFLLIARNDRMAAEYDEAFGVLAAPFRTDELLHSLRQLLRREGRGMITCQIPFAGQTF